MQAGVYIDGNWQAGSSSVFENLCPATGDTTWQGHAAGPSEVAATVNAARNAFKIWTLTPLSERISIIEAYREGLKKRQDKIAETISRDMGKALWDAVGEAGAMVGKIDLSIKALKERAGGMKVDAAFGSATLTHRPHGVMAVFGPFNFPGHLPNGHIVPALLAGNTVVFKPSEQAPSVAAIMAEAFEEAGLPKGVLNIAHGGRETGEALLKSEIDGVLFTGSHRTGTFFHQYFAGRPEIMLALEMGGNNPLIVWDPCHVEAAADIVVQSAYLTTGQRCSCARRVILPVGAFGDRVVDAIVARSEGLNIGRWDEDNIFMGPLVSTDAASGAKKFQEALLSKGAKTLLPLRQLDEQTGFVTPGIMDVTEAHDLEDEELFGPLMQIHRVIDFDTALECANDTRFGLSGGLVSDAPELWWLAKAHMKAGILNLNRPTVGASGAMPFGGPGLSGNLRPSAFYAADYCAWPQSSQIAQKAIRQAAPGFAD